MLNVQVLRIWLCYNLKLRLNAVIPLKTSQMTISFLSSSFNNPWFNVYNHDYSKNELVCQFPTLFLHEIASKPYLACSSQTFHHDGKHDDPCKE